VYSEHAALLEATEEHGSTQGLNPLFVPEAEITVGRVKLSRYATGRVDIEVDGVPTSTDDALSAVFEELEHVAKARAKAMEATQAKAAQRQSDGSAERHKTPPQAFRQRRRASSQASADANLSGNGAPSAKSSQRIVK